MILDHDTEYKILSIRWGENYHISAVHGNTILEFDNDKNIIGIELLNCPLEKNKYQKLLIGCTLKGGPFVCVSKGDCVDCEHRKRVEGD